MKMCIPLSGYIDDFFTKGNTFSIWEKNIHKIMRLYDKLGFVINFQKSRTVPTQRIRILGFAIDTVKMIITHILHFKESCNLIG